MSTCWGNRSWMRRAIMPTIGRCSSVACSCSAVRRSPDPGGSFIVDGSFGSLSSALQGGCGIVREACSASTSICGGAQEPFAKSLIFTPAEMRWPKWRGHLRPSEPLGGCSRRRLSYQASTDIQDPSTVLCVTLLNDNRSIHRKARSILLAITLASLFRDATPAQTLHTESKGAFPHRPSANPSQIRSGQN
jgi:hypothetical protein